MKDKKEEPREWSKEERGYGQVHKVEYVTRSIAQGKESVCVRVRAPLEPMGLCTFFVQLQCMSIDFDLGSVYVYGTQTE